MYVYTFGDVMITPEAYAKDTEHSHQVALFIWASMPEQQKAYPELKYMFAIPNGGKRDKITAANLKAEGVKAGVPDIMLPVAKHGCHGLFIEMKKPKDGVVSGKQDEFLTQLRFNGYYAETCYSWLHAIDCIVWYMGDSIKA